MSLNRREKSSWQWVREPVLVPRWMLIVGYAVYIELGVAALLTTIPSLLKGTSSVYVNLIAAGIVVFAIIAIVGAARDRFYRAEMVGALLIGVLMTSYLSSAVLESFSDGTFLAGRAVFSIVVQGMTLFPLGRGLSMLPRYSRERAVRLADRH